MNELEASDLIVDQPEPRLQDENGTRSAAKVARTGDVVESDKNGAQVIETILLNRTLASVNEELRQQSMDNQGFTKTHSAAKLPICPMPPPDLSKWILDFGSLGFGGGGDGMGPGGPFHVGEGADMLECGPRGGRLCGGYGVEEVGS